MGRVQGKVAIVTGAAGGIGFADAEVLAKEGAKVVILDVSEDGVKAAAEKIVADGGEAIGIVCDVSSQEAWANVIEKTVATYGRIDVLVNNAAIAAGKDLTVQTVEEWNRVIAVNLTGPFLGMQAVVPEMRKVGGGSIINISSIAALAGGRTSDGGDAAYSASKGGVRSMTKHAAQLLAGDSIRVNSLHPGSILTDNSKKHRAAVGGESWAPEKRAESIPLPPHQGVPEDIAYGVVYLASDESKFTTGIELVIDGGYTSR